MAEIKVTSKELRDKALELRQLNTKFRGEVDKMIGYRNQLDSMWDGDARLAFDKAFDTDRGKWDTFAKNIDDYAQKMEEMAKAYEDAEAKATEVATTRK